MTGLIQDKGPADIFPCAVWCKKADRYPGKYGLHGAKKRDMFNLSYHKAPLSRFNCPVDKHKQYNHIKKIPYSRFLQKTSKIAILLMPVPAIEDLPVKKTIRRCQDKNPEQYVTGFL
jgi:hypothetical protein